MVQFSRKADDLFGMEGGVVFISARVAFVIVSKSSSVSSSIDCADFKVAALRFVACCGVSPCEIDLVVGALCVCLAREGTLMAGLI